MGFVVKGQTAIRVLTKEEVVSHVAGMPMRNSVRGSDRVPFGISVLQLRQEKPRFAEQSLGHLGESESFRMRKSKTLEIFSWSQVLGNFSCFLGIYPIQRKRLMITFRPNDQGDLDDFQETFNSYSSSKNLSSDLAAIDEVMAAKSEEEDRMNDSTAKSDDAEEGEVDEKTMSPDPDPQVEKQAFESKHTILSC